MERPKTYFPSQPEIQQRTNQYQELKPLHLSYARDVALFYQFTTDPISPPALSLIPDGCFDLLFCCDESQPAAFLWTSPYSRRKQPAFSPDCTYFGVRFFPEQSLLKFKVPMAELLDQQIQLFDVFPGEQKIVEELIVAGTFQERIRAFMAFLDQAKVDLDKEIRLVKHAIAEIYRSKGTINIQEVAFDVGCSEQYIRRRFEAYIGFSPKQFSQVVKFQNALDYFLAPEQPDMLDIVHETGYYDQAHFIKDFKKFMQVTPKQYKKEQT
ncbi:helix-turn-helix domain-containing protein [Planomicrobium sp. CPCC 101110]|uniref:helix-turn-helix domain-containing protein n=1 Tax=Planomicrobium sp. CPCC 101110 TaxID=2599619 RepID=UPI0011B41C4D|nr:helix-turn-helix domain-containing protein [Planomicrobium sp. CPCC 101110]TWT25274.1 AraC family transcriptional regulator [Planomicrobium sp. CPCC 101110]